MQSEKANPYPEDFRRSQASAVRGKTKRFVIAAAEFHKPLVEKLLEGALAVLKEAHVEKSQIEIRWAPGAFELPLLAKRMIQRFHPRAAICLGAVIKGDTSHWRVISQACANGCQKVSLMTGVPVAFGVLTCETAEQAYERSGGKINRGAEAAEAAMKAAGALEKLKTRNRRGR